MAATEIANAYIALHAQLPGVKNEISKALGGSDVEAEVDNAGRTAGSRWGTALAIGITAATAVVAAAAFSLTKSVVQAFGELEQNIGGSEAVFGEYASSVQKMGEEAYKNLGVSQSEYLANANKMGALFQGSGIEQQRSLELTTQAMQRAADMASVMGIDMAWALESVTGAAKGNFTMMDNLGVAMNATTIEAYAASKGMEGWSYATATSAEKSELAMEMFLENTSQYAGNFAREATDTVTGSFGQMSAAWQDLIAGLGDEDADMDRLTSNLTQAIRDVVKNLQPVVENVFKALPEVIGGVLAGIGPIVENFVRSIDFGPLTFAFDVLKAAISWLVDNSDFLIAALAGIGAAILYSLLPTIQAAIVATWGWTAALLANPVTWITLAIVALIAALVLLVMNWDTVVAWITEVWAGFIGWITGVIEGFIGWWNDLWAGFGQWTSDVWSGFVGFITGVWSGFIGWIEGVLNGFLGWWNGIWGALGSFASDVVTNIRTVWENVWSGIGSFLRDTWNNILGWIEGGVNGAIDLINGLTGGFRDILAMVGIQVAAVPHVSIPRLAEGGIIRARPGGIIANIGEGRYDEAVVPLSPSVLGQLGGGGGLQDGQEIRLVIPGHQFDGYVSLVAHDQILADFSDQSATASRGRLGHIF